MPISAAAAVNGARARGSRRAPTREERDFADGDRRDEREFNRAVREQRVRGSEAAAEQRRNGAGKNRVWVRGFYTRTRSGRRVWRRGYWRSNNPPPVRNPR